MFKQKKQLKDFHSYSYSTFDKELQNGVITFFDSNLILNVYDTQSLEIVLMEKREGAYSINYVQNNIFLSNEKCILSVDVNNACINEYFKLAPNSEKSIGLLTKELVIESKSKVVDFEIVELEQSVINIISGEKIYYLNELSYVMFIQNDSIYLQSLKNDNIIRRNIITKVEDYSLKLDNGSFGQRIIGQTEDMFFLQRVVSKPNLFNVLALEKSTGKIIWETENTHPYYCFDEVNNKLYGLGDKRFEAINTLTGKKELTTELGINVYIFSHLTYYNDGFLYFSSHLDNNIPVFGAVNVETGKLDFVQEVKIEGEKSFRIGLEKPIVVGNRLYIKDSLNTLHIFEKTEKIS